MSDFQDTALQPSEALERAKAANEASRQSSEQALEAANAAGSYLDQLSDTLGLAAHSATGGAIDPFVFRLTIFVLAIFVGYYVVWAVTPALHTPLMSVTNAISSVIVVGALLAVGIEPVLHHFQTGPQDATGLSTFFGFLALVLASVNIFGGFLVTSRMLAMYKKKQK
jgi:NAD(P) transhydrogenase subunit alpha